MTYLYVAIVSFFSGIVQSVTGFGCGVVMMIFYPNIMGIVSGAAVSSASGLALTSSMTYKFRKKVDIKNCIMPVVVYMIVCSITINHIKDMDVLLLEILFGAFLVCLSIYLLLVAQKAHFVFSMPLVALFAAISGLTAGLFSIGGPLMALYFLNITKDNDSYKGTTQFFFFLTGINGLITRLRAGILTKDLIPFVIAGMIGILLGSKTGLLISSKLNQKLTKVLVYIFVGVSGLIILAQQLL